MFGTGNRSKSSSLFSSMSPSGQSKFDSGGFKAKDSFRGNLNSPNQFASPNNFSAQMPQQMSPMAQMPQTMGNFSSMIPDAIQQRMGGNTGITGGMGMQTPGLQDYRRQINPDLGNQMPGFNQGLQQMSPMTGGGQMSPFWKSFRG